jgi:hypothetical protein
MREMQVTAVRRKNNQIPGIRERGSIPPKYKVVPLYFMSTFALTQKWSKKSRLRIKSSKLNRPAKEKQAIAEEQNPAKVRFTS